MRMQSHGRSTANKLNMHGFRTWRVSYRITTWFYRGDLATSPENRKIEAQLTPQQWANNTTRGLTPGLIDPSQGPGSASVPFPQFGPDEGFPRKPRGPPPGHQGPTRSIDWKPSHVGPNQTIAAAASTMPTTTLSSAPVVSSTPQSIAPAASSSSTNTGNLVGNVVTSRPRRRRAPSRQPRASSSTPSSRGQTSNRTIRRRPHPHSRSTVQALSSQAGPRQTIDEDAASENFDQVYHYSDEDADHDIIHEEEQVPIAPIRNDEAWRNLPVQIGRQLDNPINPFRQPYHTSEYDVYMSHCRHLF